MPWLPMIGLTTADGRASGGRENGYWRQGGYAWYTRYRLYYSPKNSKTSVLPESRNRRKLPPFRRNVW